LTGSWEESESPFHGGDTRFTTRTKTLFKIAQTRTKIPAPRTIVEAIFFNTFKLDCHNMGRGIAMRYISVETLEANDTQMMGLEMAA
jgi:hypothetical protein